MGGGGFLDPEPSVRLVKNGGMLNNTLKSICSSEGLKTNGVKAQLQNRIIESTFYAHVISMSSRFRGPFSGAPGARDWWRNMRSNSLLTYLSLFRNSSICERARRARIQSPEKDHRTPGFHHSTRLPQLRQFFFPSCESSTEGSSGVQLRRGSHAVAIV
jgi:hypothetical protein